VSSATSTEEALGRLGEQTAEAVSNVLGMLAPGSVERGSVSIVPANSDPLTGIQTPAVATNVSYVDGVTGGNLFVVTVEAGRRLAAAMMGAEPPEPGGELSELELSAVSEAMNQMMAGAAGATSVVLGEEVEIGTPETRLLAQPSDAEGLYAKTPHATIVGYKIFGEPCRLVQLVPNAFVVRIGRALGEQSGEVLSEQVETDAPAFGGDVLRGVGLRVWAELGRARLPIGRAVGLAPGSVVELDHAADDPVELYVNGRRFATGRLHLAEDGEWAVRIEAITPPASVSATPGGV
jgi:flagellar motor switch protein FliN/FliY